MTEQKTAMEIWNGARNEATAAGVDGVYFFGDAIIDMQFALERSDDIMRELRHQRDEAERQVSVLKAIIERMEMERRAA